MAIVTLCFKGKFRGPDFFKLLILVNNSFTKLF